MGREKRVLLGLLGLLAGIFVGLLSKKLLVPRPPAGVGPDVDVRTAYVEPTELVEPPRLTLRASDFAAAPPLVAAMSSPAPQPAAVATGVIGSGVIESDTVESDTVARPVSMFVPSPDGDDLLPPPAEFMAASARPVPPVDDEEHIPAAAAAPQPLAPVDAAPLRSGPPEIPAPPTAAGVTSASFTSAGEHVARVGDSWWSIAESAYGDGRLYRAVFAWNRAVDPRVSLAVGTRLELPPLEKLRAAWPALVPPAP